ncbi:MAG TPA: DEAD/DEAH box helicase [Rhizomicrobium sp.]|nr:DEAD/DEAH box helicase [Rhizomicrobium sp.]
MTFESLGVSEPLLRALKSENYTHPTPIQGQAIPAILSGRDVLGLAQTGTGKTAAFGLPLLQRLSEDRSVAGPRHARALILAPTRELAVQISDSLKTYGRHLHLRSTVILGGVSQNKQVEAMKNGVDILVATPGRLLDLVRQKQVHLEKATTLVLDEADRMFDMGFIKDVRKLISFLPKQRLSLLFSATMPKEVAHLCAEVLNQPLRIEVTPKKVAADAITQSLYHVEVRNKQALLHKLLHEDAAMKRVIVFTRTKHGANKVADKLGMTGIGADAIHGNKSQNARQRALESFRSGHIRVLVATDIAARGIDIDDVTHVVNYELPNEPESYVHRIGRTARAGAQGIAIAFCAPEERAQLKAIERLVRQPLTLIATPELPALELPRHEHHHEPRGHHHRGHKPHGHKPGGHKHGGHKHGGQHGNEHAEKRDGENAPRDANNNNANKGPRRRRRFRGNRNGGGQQRAA